MVLSRIPLRVHAAAMEPVRLFTAAFAAAYGAACGIASRLAPEEIFTMAPLPWARLQMAAQVADPARQQARRAGRLNAPVPDFAQAPPRESSRARLNGEPHTTAERGMHPTA